MFENWNIVKDSSEKHFYLYGPLSDFDQEELEGYTKVVESELTAEDYVILFGNLLEDNNRHNITNLGHEVLVEYRESMAENNSKENEVIFIKNFIIKFCEDNKIKL